MYRDLSTLLIEAFGLPGVAVKSLREVSSKALHKNLLPPSPVPRSRTWCHLAHPSLPGLAADVVFSLLYIVFPLQVYHHDLRLGPSSHCLCCPSMVEDVLHFFIACPCIVAAWSFCSLRVALVTGGPVLDQLLLVFAFPAGKLDRPVAIAFTPLTFNRDGLVNLKPLLPLVCVWVHAANCGPVKSIFSL
jgi:hypothetical protein